MKSTDIKQMAKLIARELFTDGSGIRAARLQLLNGPGSALGGWCEGAAIDIITEVLSGKRPAPPVVGTRITCQNNGTGTIAVIRPDGSVIISWDKHLDGHFWDPTKFTIVKPPKKEKKS